MTKIFHHLAPEEHEQLLYILRIFEDMFNGTLCMWSTKPVDLELKDDTKPVWLRPYPLPRLNKDIFRKKVDRLVSLSSLERSNDLEWGSTSFYNLRQKQIWYDFWAILDT